MSVPLADQHVFTQRRRKMACQFCGETLAPHSENFHHKCPGRATKENEIAGRRTIGTLELIGAKMTRDINRATTKRIKATRAKAQ